MSSGRLEVKGCPAGRRGKKCQASGKNRKDGRGERAIIKPLARNYSFYFVSPEWNPDGTNFVDYGLGAFLKKAGYPEAVYGPQLGKHKVPTVRNVDKRPYPEFVKAFMHNGALKSLEEVVHFYNTRDIETWPAPELPMNLNSELFEGHPIGNFQFSAEAEAAVVAFLKTLTDGYTPPAP